MKKRFNLTYKKRILLFFMFVVFASIILFIHVFIIQVINGNKWKAKLDNQQYVRRTITANRGTIYDATGKNVLAKSGNIEMVTVNPIIIKQEFKEPLARKLSEIFELEYDRVLKKLNRKSAIEIIVKKVEKDKTNLLRNWMKENNLYAGINIDEDTKRYYPYSTTASQIIGFIGNDNQGLDGIEAKYNDVLTGKDGSISKMQDAKGNQLGDSGEKLDLSKMGNSLVLTIDLNIQSIAEKYLEDACIENKCTNGGNIIIMNPKNGDILAMANYPNYDLNNPYNVQEEDIKSIWQELDSSEKTKYLQSIWRNKAIQDTYEPGSTFKLVTASSSIEEKIATADKKGVYNCSGSIEIAKVKIKCWRYYKPHGSQSLREALMNSCNPVFIGLGQKIGVNKYYEYLEKFGFLRKTGIDLYGEAKSIFLNKEKVGPVELATISFGQRFEVTPIQMITMLSTIANNGVYVKPRIVKEIINEETNEHQILESSFGERVISEETSRSVLDMMRSVVSEGTGKNAKVEGYNVGGKTGTSEDGVKSGKYIASFLGTVPTEDPKITIIVILYNPTGEKGHQGGTVAAPVAGKVLKEVIEYLEI